MDQAVLGTGTAPGTDQLESVEDWVDSRPPSFPYPDREDLISTFFVSYLDVECLVTEKIAEWREVIDQERSFIKEDMRIISGLPDERARWFWTEALKVLPPAKRIRQALKHIARLERCKSAARRVFGIREPVSHLAAFEDKVKQAREIPVLEAISGVVEVKRAGKNYLALCPFHNDRHPSLCVYPETNTFHCFGCQKGGDAIAFVRLHFGYGFRQAVQYLLGGVEDERKSVRGGIRRREEGSLTGGQDSGKKAA
jgi:hypothetical protein